MVHMPAVVESSQSRLSSESHDLYLVRPISNFYSYPCNVIAQPAYLRRWPIAFGIRVADRIRDTVFQRRGSYRAVVWWSPARLCDVVNVPASLLHETVIPWRCHQSKDVGGLILCSKPIRRLICKRKTHGSDLTWAEDL